MGDGCRAPDDVPAHLAAGVYHVALLRTHTDIHHAATGSAPHHIQSLDPVHVLYVLLLRGF